MRLVAAFSHEAEKFGLSVPMWRVLAVLAEDGEQRQIDVAQRTSIDASTLSRLMCGSTSLQPRNAGVASKLPG